MEKVKPIVIKDEFGNEKFVLEYNREAVRMAEDAGLDIQKMGAKAFSSIEDLFFFAFHKNHPKMNRADVENVRKEIGGLTDAIIERLAQLYTVTVTSLMADEESQKNARMTVQL